MLLHIFRRMEAPSQQANVVQKRESNVKGIPSTTTENQSLNQSSKKSLIKWGKYKLSSNVKVA